MFLAPRFFPIVLNPVMGFYLSIVDGLVKLF
jgi:hypothetical protein